jgi:endonuclease/exonuclease/phosphatase (EEP) superfamily protein YafD
MPNTSQRAARRSAVPAPYYVAWPRAQVMLLDRRGLDPVPSGPGTIEVRLGVSGVAALILTALAFPSLLARITGGHPPRPRPQLAALAPVAVLPALAAVVIAAATAWWLAVLLALPAVMLLAWQLPPPRPPGYRARAGSGLAAEEPTLRIFTLNTRGGWADAEAVLRTLRRHDVDVLAVQELTPSMMSRLAADLAEVLPSTHLDPRPGSAGSGLWARWPLHPLPPLPGLAAATPRARVDLAGGRPVTLAVVHVKAPTTGRATQWQRELALLGSGLAGTPGPQVVAGDFNASRDHQPFRDVLARGFLDCADAAQRRPWPGFTWPTSLDTRVNQDQPRFRDWLRTWRTLPVMRLDHVLVSRAGAAVREVRTIRIPGTDHRGVLAVIDFPRRSGEPAA